jgi:hypothetical protein
LTGTEPRPAPVPLPLTLRIADLALEVGADTSAAGVPLPPAYRGFQDPGPPELRLTLGAAPGIPAGARLTFDCPPIWSLWRAGASSIFSIYPGYPGLAHTLTLGDSAGLARLDHAAGSPEPFRGPALELLMIETLAPAGGAVLHGCGVAANGRGIAFLGESGAGKTTLARLWGRRPGVAVLSDDRLVLRRRGGRFILYGTPWHGEGRFAAPGGVPLERLFFLRHGAKNAAAALRPPAVVAELLKCAFPPLWDPAKMSAVLALFAAAAAALPCRELSFTPDEAALDVALAAP